MQRAPRQPRRPNLDPTGRVPPHQLGKILIDGTPVPILDFGAWSATVKYVRGNVVTDLGVQYIANDANLNNEPPNDFWNPYDPTQLFLRQDRLWTPPPQPQFQSPDGTILIDPTTDAPLIDLELLNIPSCMFSGTVSTPPTLSTGSEPNITDFVNALFDASTLIPNAPTGMFQVDAADAYGAGANLPYIGMDGTYLVVGQAYPTGGPSASLDPTSADMSGAYGIHCELTDIHASRGLWGNDTQFVPCDRFGQCKFQSIGGYNGVTPAAPSLLGVSAYYYDQSLGDLALTIDMMVFRISQLAGDYS